MKERKPLMDKRSRFIFAVHEKAKFLRYYNIYIICFLINLNNSQFLVFYMKECKPRMSKYRVFSSITSFFRIQFAVH